MGGLASKASRFFSRPTYISRPTITEAARRPDGPRKVKVTKEMLADSKFREDLMAGRVVAMTEPEEVKDMMKDNPRRSEEKPDPEFLKALANVFPLDEKPKRSAAEDKRRRAEYRQANLPTTAARHVITGEVPSVPGKLTQKEVQHVLRRSDNDEVTPEQVQKVVKEFKLSQDDVTTIMKFCRTPDIRRSGPDGQQIARWTWEGTQDVQETLFGKKP